MSMREHEHEVWAPVVVEDFVFATVARASPHGKARSMS